MTTRVPVALPWYNRHEYQALLALFSDPKNLPKTFDEWLEHAEKVEKQLQAAGFAVARILISPASFRAWCDERGAKPDQRARLSFANEIARARHGQQGLDLVARLDALLGESKSVPH